MFKHVIHKLLPTAFDRAGLSHWPPLYLARSTITAISTWLRIDLDSTVGILFGDDADLGGLPLCWALEVAVTINYHYVPSC